MRRGLLPLLHLLRGRGVNPSPSDLVAFGAAVLAGATAVYNTRLRLAVEDERNTERERYAQIHAVLEGYDRLVISLQDELTQLRARVILMEKELIRVREVASHQRNPGR